MKDRQQDGKVEILDLFDLQEGRLAGDGANNDLINCACRRKLPVTTWTPELKGASC